MKALRIPFLGTFTNNDSLYITSLDVPRINQLISRTFFSTNILCIFFLTLFFILLELDPFLQAVLLQLIANKRK